MTVNMNKVKEYFDNGDRSFQCDEIILFLRLENLFERLSDCEGDYESYDRLSDDDLRYALPESINGHSDIKSAIKMVKETLSDRFDISADEFIDDDYLAENIPDYDQMTFDGFFSAGYSYTAA